MNLTDHDDINIVSLYKPSSIEHFLTFFKLLSNWKNYVMNKQNLTEKNYIMNKLVNNYISCNCLYKFLQLLQVQLVIDCKVTFIDDF